MRSNTRPPRVIFTQLVSRLAPDSPRHFARCLAVLTFFIAAFASAPAARATTIDVEVLTDVLAVDQVCTLREAIINANNDAATWPDCAAGSGPDIIQINPSGTITLTIANTPGPFNGEQLAVRGDLDLLGSLVINGNPSGTTIDGNDLDRIFDINPDTNVDDGIPNAPIVVALNNLTITNGRIHDQGGALQVNANATVTVDNSTISNSVVTVNDGGGIFNNGGTMTMTNTTVSGNETGLLHGGISNSGTMTLVNCTVTNNRTTDGTPTRGQGLGASGSTVLRNTIVAANGPATSPDTEGTITSQGYNIIGRITDSFNNPTTTIVPTTGDQIGGGGAAVALGPLAMNGGTTPTHALGAGSIAIDQGHSSGSTADQRGLTRPCDLASVSNATGGDGGDVGAFEVQGACSGGNQPPTAVDDTFSIPEDSGPNTFDVRANDTDPEGDTLSVTAVTQGSNGSVAITGGGTGVSYTPNANFFGADSFTYTVSDGNGNSDTATVSVNVTNVQDAPVAVNDGAAVNEDSGANVINVLGNDFDVDGDALAVDSVTQGANGSVSNNGNSVSYAPNPDFFGTDSFMYTVSDGQGGFDTATVNVSVTNVNDPPVANDDSYSMNQDTTLNVSAPGVLSNDTDVDNDSLSSAYTAGNGPNHGSVVLNSDGSFTYTPDPGFTGTDSFDYTASDGHGGTSNGTVTITVADTQGPNLTSSVAVTALWQPNHNLVNVGLTVNASDNSGDPVTTQVFVFSDEDDLTADSPDHSPDAKDIAPNTLRLRAERDGSGDGRVYLILIVSTDSSNNVSRNCHTVVVPKSQSQADKTAVNQQAQAARSHCATTGTRPAGYFVLGDGPVVGPKQ